MSLYEALHTPSINLNSSLMVVNFPVSHFSNSKNLEAFHSLHMYILYYCFIWLLLACEKHYLLSHNILLFSAKVKSSNSLGFTITVIFLIALHPAKAKKWSVILFSLPGTVWSFYFLANMWTAKQQIHVYTKVWLNQRC